MLPLPPSTLQLLRALPDAAVFLTPQGAVLAENRPARAVLATGRANGNRHDTAFPVVEDDAERFAQLLRQWSRSTETTPGSMILPGASGPTVFDARGCTIVPATGDAPAVLFVRFWPRDLANPFLLLNQKIAELNDEIARRVQVEEALRRSEAALRERIAESEALHRSKDEFLAVASHELRTPLHAIIGWTAVLRRQATPALIEKGLDVIERNATAQANLVDDILDVSRVISGKLRLETRPCDLAGLVDDAMDVVRPSAAAKALHLHTAGALVPSPAMADPDRIRQVLWNLLSNAVKFSEPGGTVSVALAKDGARYAIEVRDTGIGIDPAFLPYVFDRFRQADSSATRRAGGLGLGLALVRHIVELHGGTVSARSDGLGRGASFTFTLPVPAIAQIDRPAPRPPDAAVASPAPVPALAVAQRPSLHGVGILVVDDDADARELVATLLTQAGGHVYVAGSAAEALQMLARVEPHVLVSDIGMPGESGYSLMGKLRTSGPSASRDIPALALTAYARDTDRESALACGFTAHLGKPVAPDILLATVATLAATSKRTR